MAEVNKEFTKRRLIRMRYLQSLMLLQGDIDLSPQTLNLNPAKAAQFIDQRSIISDGGGISGSADIIAAAVNGDINALNQLERGVVGNPVTEGSVVTTHTLADTGWVVGAQWAEIVYSRARMPIGIRELALGNLSYEPLGVIVSKEFFTIGPIGKVSLTSDEFIPPSYPTTQSYIKYEVTFDNVSFHEIAPESRITPGVPTELHINRKSETGANSAGEITLDRAPQSFRVKITLSRPTGEEYDQTTPVLKSYRFKVATT